MSPEIGKIISWLQTEIVKTLGSSTKEVDYYNQALDAAKRGKSEEAAQLALKAQEIAKIRDAILQLKPEDNPLVDTLKKIKADTVDLPIELFRRGERPLAEADFQIDKKAKRVPRKIKEHAPFGPSDVLRPEHELVLCGLLKRNFHLIQQKVFGGKDMVDIARSHGWKYQDNFETVLEFSCENKAQQRDNLPIMGPETEAIESQIRSVLNIISVNRQGWHPLGDNPDYPAWDFVWAVTKHLKGNVPMHDEFRKYLLKGRDIAVDESNFIKPVNI